MKYIPIVIILISSMLFAGCASTLPAKFDVKSNYSLLGVKSFVIKAQCDKASLDPSLNKSFAANYCQMLEGAVKMELSRTNRDFQYVPAGGDLNVDIVLEMLDGGSAAARFWVGFGAGRSVSTVFVRISRGTETLAEARITETTTMPNMVTNQWTNEDALMQDVPLVARSIAAFVNDPEKYKKESQY
jgi:hypothetical protein